MFDKFYTRVDSDDEAMRKRDAKRKIEKIVTPMHYLYS